MSWLRQVRGRNDTAPPRQGCMPSQQHLWAMQAHVTVPQMKDMKGYLPSRNDLLLTMRSESHLLPLNPGHRAAARHTPSRRAICGTSLLGTVREVVQPCAPSGHRYAPSLRDSETPCCPIIIHSSLNIDLHTVLAVYPESTTSEGTYRDSEVAAMVLEHNKNARSRAGL